VNVLESIDEQVAGIVRTYAQENELAVLVRTNGNDVRVIAPNAQRDVLAKMLRIAASMLEEPASRQFN